MGELSLPVLSHIIIFLLFPFAGGYLATRFKLPPLVGYIIGGVLMGTFFKEAVSSEILSQFASVGIILLLFTVGLELNLTHLSRFKRFVFWGGLVQIGVTALIVFILSLGFRMSLIESFFIGASFALSSTAIVSKILGERGEDNSLIGDLTLGMLVFQDLVAIPLIIILGSFGPGMGAGTIAQNMTIAIFRAGIILTLIYVVGGKLVPLLFEKAAKISREILNIATILFIFAVVYVFSFLGLSASLAAFVAGVLVAQTMQHHHIFSQIRPLRDLFAVLFFVSLGAQINIAAALPQLPQIILFSLLVTLVKLIVVLAIFIRFKFHSRTSFSVAMLMTSVGEFAFIMLSVGFGKGNVSQSTYLFALTSIVMTIIIAPILIGKRDVIYAKGKAFIKKYLPDVEHYLSYSVDSEPAHIDALDYKNHVVLCGYGRVGKYGGRTLTIAEIPFIAIDYNYYTVSESRKSDIPVLYRDSTDIDILDYAQVEYATCLISAVPNTLSQEMIILNAKRLNPDVTIFSRVNREDEQQRMKDLGAEVVVQPEFEASLAMVKKIYHAFNIPRDEILGKIKRLKIEHGMG